MNIVHILSLITAVIECLFFSGILFGWSSLRFVLEKEGYFSSQCDYANNTPATNTTPSPSTVSMNTTSIPTTTSSPSNVLMNTTSFSSILTTVSVNTTPNEYPLTCTEQVENLNLVFTVASTLLSFSTLINGFIYDRFGTWISRIVAIALFTAGCILMVVGDQETSWLLYPAMTFFAIGGILMLVTNLQIGNLFGKLRSSVITLLSGALDSSSFVFLLFNIAYGAGVKLSTIFHVTLWTTILLWVRTFILLPRLHIPFPLPKDFRYGLHDCTRSADQNIELNVVDNEETLGMVRAEPNKEPQVQIECEKKSYVSCLKTFRFWTNVFHFSVLQLRNYFFLNTLIDWLQPLCQYDKYTLNQYLVTFGTCQLFGVLSAPLNGLLIDISTKLLMKKATLEEIVPLKAVALSGMATTFLGTLFSITVAIPSLEVQYFSFILQVIFRSFLYGGNMSFIAVSFPGEHFGKLYGLTMTIGGLISLLQYPLFMLVVGSGSSFFAMNIVFVFISLITLLHPVNVYRYCRKKEMSTPILNLKNSNDDDDKVP